MKPIFLSLLMSISFVSGGLGAELFSYPIAMTTSNGGTGYVEATLADSIKADFLVDTGSSMLVVNQDTFKALKKDQAITFSHEAAARLANGKIHRVNVYSVSQFRIGEQCDIGAVEVAVINKGNNILGMEALKKAAPFAMSINPPTLMVSECLDAISPNLTAAR